MSYKQMYERWLGFDEQTKKELSGLSDDEIKDRFYKELEFGTGGLRGVIGAGTNRMNVYTVRKATQGLAKFILKQNIEKPSVAIAYDSRRYSDVFAREAGLVLAANGIKAYIYDELKPTPMLSYAVRRLKCTAGIVVTASHNPKEYNGYKVYWNDGGQVTEEHAGAILDEIRATDYADIPTIAFDKAVTEGLYENIPVYVEDDYMDSIEDLIVEPSVIKKSADDFKIVYTPLNGTGNKPVRKALKKAGFKNVIIVPEQENPDPEFSTLKYPNPEDKDAFTLAMKLAKENNADLIIGTDPDCDRIGAVVRNSNGEYQVLTGNQTGSLLTYYMLSQLERNHKMPENPMVIKTVVTTELARKICEDFGVEIIDVLTGFKYIGEKIKEFEGKKNFILGYEESYGYLAGNFVRDKDAVIAALLISEMAAYYKLKGMNLYDGLMDIYEKYGYYVENLKSLTFKGIEGAETIKNMMKNMRQDAPKKVAGIPVAKVIDYLETEKTGLPKSNVIQIILEDGSKISARPSGTEPKIKFYFAAVGNSLEDAKNKAEAFEKEIIK